MHQYRILPGRTRTLLLAIVFLCFPGAWHGTLGPAPLNTWQKSFLQALSIAHAAEPAPKLSETHIVLRLNAEPQLQQELMQFGQELLREGGITDPHPFLRRLYPGRKTIIGFPSRTLATVLSLSVFCDKDIALKPEPMPGQKTAYELSFTAEGRRKRMEPLLEQTLAVIRSRLAQAGIEATAAADLQPEHIVITAPAPTEAKTTLYTLGNTARLEFRLVRNDISSVREDMPTGVEVLPLAGDPGGVLPEDRFLALESPAAMTGRHVSHAEATRDSYDDRPVITLQFDAAGGEKFATLTAANIGRRLAIVLDGKILSAPFIHDVITGGEASISGNFTQAEAETLALALRAGALPVPLEVVDIKKMD